MKKNQLLALVRNTMCQSGLLIETSCLGEIGHTNGLWVGCFSDNNLIKIHFRTSIRKYFIFLIEGGVEFCVVVTRVQPRNANRGADEIWDWFHLVQTEWDLSTHYHVIWRNREKRFYLHVKTYYVKEENNNLTVQLNTVAEYIWYQAPHRCMFSWPPWEMIFLFNQIV